MYLHVLIFTQSIRSLKPCIVVAKHRLQCESADVTQQCAEFEGNENCAQGDEKKIQQS